jgi:hypothetical protein
MDTFSSSPPPIPLPGSSQPVNRSKTVPVVEIQVPNRPAPTIPSSQFTFDLSSDPIAIAIPPTAPGNSAGGPHRPSFLNRKRTPTSPPPGRRIDKAPRGLAQDCVYTAKTAILEARDLIVLASTLAESRDEQSRLLDLLEVFREYTEKGLLYKASSIITSQIANLETATRQIESKARDLNKTTVNTTKPQIPTYAQIAQGPQAPPQAPQSTAEQAPGPKTVAKPPKPTKAKPTERRVILVQATPLPVNRENPNFNPIRIRNAFNKAYNDKGVTGPVVATIARSRTGNIVVTATSAFTADYVLETEDTWKEILPYTGAHKPQSWYKVVIDAIPTADFDHPQGMALIIEEIKTFNKGLTPVGLPYWLTSVENRKEQRAGSIVVSFPTEEQAKRALHNRLYVAGMSVRVRKYHSTASTAQCAKCGGFGHLSSFCKKKEYSCLLCSETHATEQHYCSVCKRSGTKCMHLAPKCLNCKGTHTADSKQCEVYQALKNRLAAGEATEPITLDE